MFRNLGIVGDLYSLGERIKKMWEKGKVIIKEIVEAAGDFVTGFIEGLAGALTIFASFAMDYVKSTKLYKSAMKAITNYITPLIKDIVPAKFEKYIE